MSYRTQNYEQFVPLILALPASTYYDVHYTGTRLSIQAPTREQAKAIIDALGGEWKWRWSGEQSWWGANATLDHIKLNIYGCKEPPREGEWEPIYEKEAKIIGWKKKGESK